MKLFKWFKSILETPTVQEALPVAEEAKFPPLPPGHFFRVRKNTLTEFSRWPILVTVHKKQDWSSVSVKLSVSEASPEGIAEAMQELSDSLMSKYEADKAVEQYCGDYYP